MADINIYGTLKNATSEATIATADQIQDTDEKKKQSEINKDFKSRILTLESSGGGGGGTGGTGNYDDLSNKPKIGGVELSGNKSLDDLGIQKKLSPGKGIEITAGGEIRVVLDDSPFLVVDALPTQDINTDKIYLVADSASADQENNRYAEYLYVGGKWEKVGTYSPQVSLEEYLKKSDAQQQYQPKGDYALKSEIPSTEGLATKESVESVEARVEGLEGLAGSYCCMGEWTEGELDPDAASLSGDKSILEEWDGYLLDTTDNARATTRPVGRLKRNNWLRFDTGKFAPTVGITVEQKAQCDAELYLDQQHTQKWCDAGQFDPEKFYTEKGMSQKLYTAEGTEVTHIVRPWETVETKYTIGVAHRRKLYLIDQVKGKSGKVWRGISSAPVTVDGVDASAWPLERTAMSPTPVCTVDGKARCFFYLYEGENNCKSSAGQNNLCTMFSNGRTYPRVNDMQQVNDMKWARANNADAESPYPFAEGGYHALNAFLTAMEALYGTKYLHKDTLFGSGISSNDTCNSEETWKLHGGVRYRISPSGEWKYDKFSSMADIYYSANKERTTFTVLLNQEYPKRQCLEAQMAASFAVETGVPEDTEFEFYDGTYWYETPSGAKGLNDGFMNARIYKRMSQTFSAYDSSGMQKEWDVEVILRMGLLSGMDVSGDTFAYWGGGYEQVGTCKYLQSVQRHGNPVDLYVQPDQKGWTYETAITKDGTDRFSFEDSYVKVASSENLNDGYALSRSPYTGWRTAAGGSIGQGECFYSWNNNYWSNVLGQRARIAARFRGFASYAACSARSLNAYHACSNASRTAAGSAQAMIE